MIGLPAAGFFLGASRSLTLAAGAALASLLLAGQATAQEFWAGKTVTLVIGFGPGGSTAHAPAAIVARAKKGFSGEK